MRRRSRWPAASRATPSRRSATASSSSGGDALELPEQVREIKRVIETHLPRIRIEDLLVEVDRWCGFTRELVPLPGYRPRTERPYAALG